MINIRKGLFETNSSSVHSLVMCTKDEYNKWKNGEMVLDYYLNDLVSSACSDNNYRYKTFEQYEGMLEERCYETFFKEKDEILAFGYYGHDG